MNLIELILDGYAPSLRALIAIAFHDRLHDMRKVWEDKDIEEESGKKVLMPKHIHPSWPLSSFGTTLHCDVLVTHIGNHHTTSPLLCPHCINGLEIKSFNHFKAKSKSMSVLNSDKLGEVRVSEFRDKKI